MCAYCDCRSLPAISRLSRDHADILELADELTLLVNVGGPSDATFDRFLAMLREHGRREEAGLFAELSLDEAFADAMRALRVEHRTIYRVLRLLRRNGTDAHTLRSALGSLFRHILREERGLFPPAAIMLSTEALERADTPGGRWPD
ncbi:MAG: hemerythrin domain-containing protein [Dactylosporangium sp.]|nr:hemerythrin domain-containing protein [Dactylosporangium sp.]